MRFILAGSTWIKDQEKSAGFQVLPGTNRGRCREERYPSKSMIVLQISSSFCLNVGSIRSIQMLSSMLNFYHMLYHFKEEIARLMSINNVSEQTSSRLIDRLAFVEMENTQEKCG